MFEISDGRVVGFMEMEGRSRNVVGQRIIQVHAAG